MESATETVINVEAPKSAPGNHLKRAREARNLTLDEVSRAIKIRKEFLTAIEQGEYTTLPGPVFTRGFVRSYGAFLGLDAAQTLELFDQLGPIDPLTSLETRVPTRQERGGGSSNLPLIAVGIAVAVAVVAVASYLLFAA